MYAIYKLTNTRIDIRERRDLPLRGIGEEWEKRLELDRYLLSSYSNKPYEQVLYSSHSTFWSHLEKSIWNLRQKLKKDSALLTFTYKKITK